jgi:DNA-binding MarR family transcriptional regulator
MQSAPALSHESTAILDDLRRLVRVLRESSRAAESELGVTGAQLFVLRALAGTPALSLNALAARTRTHQSSVSVVVKRLVARGFVSRTASAEDARCLELKLTRRGRLLLERAPLAAQDRVIHGIEALPAQQRALLAGGLQALLRAMGSEDDAPEMFFEENSVAASPATHSSKRSQRSVRS